MFGYRHPVSIVMIATTLIFPMSCLLASPSAADTKPILVGIVVPVTGPYGNVGSEFVLGARNYIEMINSAGGLQGRLVQIVVGDTECRGANELSQTKKIVERDGVDLVIRVPCGGASDEISKYLRHVNISSLDVGPYTPNTPERHKDGLVLKMGNDATIRRRIAQRLKLMNIETLRSPCEFFGQGFPDQLGTVICAYHGERTFEPDQVKMRVGQIGIRPDPILLASSAFLHGIAAAQVILKSTDKTIQDLGRLERSAIANAMKGQVFDTVLGEVGFDTLGNSRQSQYVVLTTKEDVYNKILDSRANKSIPREEGDIDERPGKPRDHQGPNNNFKVVCKRVCTTDSNDKTTYTTIYVNGMYN